MPMALLDGFFISKTMKIICVLPQPSHNLLYIIRIMLRIFSIQRNQCFLFSAHTLNWEFLLPVSEEIAKSICFRFFFFFYERGIRATWKLFLFPLECFQQCWKMPPFLTILALCTTSYLFKLPSLGLNEITSHYCLWSCLYVVSDRIGHSHD